MRKFAFLITLWMTCTIGVIGAADRVLVEGIMVRVNERIITVSDFTERLRNEISQMSPPPDGEQVKEFAEVLLDELVNELVLMERATEKRLEIDDAVLSNPRRPLGGRFRVLQLKQKKEITECLCTIVI